MPDHVPAAATAQNSGPAATPSLLNSDATAGANAQQASATPAATPAATQTPAPDANPQPGDGTLKDAPIVPAGAPEKYEFKFPEGVNVDTKALEAFEPLARKLDLPQDKAQSLIDLYAQMRQSEVQQQQEAMSTMVAEWGKQTMADPELGGPKWEETKVSAKRFLSEYGNPGIERMLDEYGLGNNPDFIRMLAKAGKAMGSDTFIAGSTGAAGEDSEAARASRMFPKTLGSMKK